jgi:hypothetical protein
VAARDVTASSNVRVVRILLRIHLLLRVSPGILLSICLRGVRLSRLSPVGRRRGLRRIVGRRVVAALMVHWSRRRRVRVRSVSRVRRVRVAVTVTRVAVVNRKAEAHRSSRRKPTREATTKPK